MALLAVELDQLLYSRILDLVADGDYRDIQQVIDVALRNHLQLEQRHRSARGRVTTIAEGAPPRASGPSRVERSSSPVRSGSETTRSVGRTDTNWDEVVAAFRFSVQQSTALEACATNVRAPDEQLYALVNRLFPLKLIARWLDVQANAIGHWAMAIDAVKCAGHDIELFGSALAQRDVLANRRREEQLATSLPRIENPKSKERFVSQFIARFTDSGEIFPAGIVQFALASIKNGQLLLSEKGQELSRLSNPLIDEADPNVSDTLTVDERRLLLGQIRSYMPAEAAHLLAVLLAVNNGATSPERLVTELHGQFAGRSTDAAFRSHLSGVVARAIDLRLLQREWEGRYVSYRLTETGSVTLADMSKKHHQSADNAPHTPNEQLL